MSQDRSRRRWPAAKALTLAAALSIFLALTSPAVFLCLAAAPARAVAAGAAGSVVADSLNITMDRWLTQANETPSFTISGEAVAGLSAGDVLAVRIAGPATLTQVEQGEPVLPVAGSFSVAAGSLPSVARPSPSQVHLPVPPATLPPAPGAYRLIVEVRSGGVLVGTGTTWMGRVATRTEPLDLAFVWRAALGIHRGPDGVFVDSTLEQACRPDGQGANGGAATESATVTESGALAALAGLSGQGLQFPEGEVVKVRLESGGNAIRVLVVGDSSAEELVATLVGGSTTLDTGTTSLRFLTFMDILPWGALAVFVVLVAVVAVLLTQRRKRSRAA